MPLPFVGEIRMFAGRDAPQGWAICDGRLLQIDGNEALFQLIETTYGGDGENTFALPDLRGRVPIHMGDGYSLADAGGVEQVSLFALQMPHHTHTLAATTASASQNDPQGNLLAQSSNDLYVQQQPNGNLAFAAVGLAGESQPHPNLQPYLAINFIIALEGNYPPPS